MSILQKIHSKFTWAFQVSPYKCFPLLFQVLAWDESSPASNYTTRLRDTQMVTSMSLLVLTQLHGLLLITFNSTLH